MSRPPSDEGGPLASPSYYLHKAALAWQREFGARLREHGITPTQFNALASLSWVSRTAPDPTQQEIAEFSGIDRMMASRLFETLESAGHITRRPDPRDRRVRRLELTASGRELVRVTTAIARALDRELYDVVDQPVRLRDELWRIESRASELGARRDEIGDADPSGAR